MLYELARPFLFSLDPEAAHKLTLGLTPLYSLLHGAVPSRPVSVMGLQFRNPVGLAAGLDKDAERPDALAALGFGFIELGGVTLRPQPGNPKPRLFRIPQARALINRFGFNSIGVHAFAENLRRSRARSLCIVGANIGKNKDTPPEAAGAEYEQCLEVLYPLVDYVTINVSSPNTQGLRDMQAADALGALLAGMRAKRDALRERHGRQVALAVKIAPDLDDSQVKEIAEVLVRAKMDGVVATNTTVSREGVQGLPFANEAGGLSGAPLHARALRVLSTLVSCAGRDLAVIGSGGIMSGADAAETFAAGARLVQLYTGLVYSGPGLIRECVLSAPA